MVNKKQLKADLNDLHTTLETEGYKAFFYSPDMEGTYKLMASKNRQTYSLAIWDDGIHLTHTANYLDKFAVHKRKLVTEKIFASVGEAQQYISEVSPVLIGNEPRVIILSSPED